MPNANDNFAFVLADNLFIRAELEMLFTFINFKCMKSIRRRQTSYTADHCIRSLRLSTWISRLYFITYNYFLIFDFFIVAIFTGP